MKRTNAYALYAATFVVSFVAGAAAYNIFFA